MSLANSAKDPQHQTSSSLVWCLPTASKMDGPSNSIADAIVVNQALATRPPSHNSTKKRTRKKSPHEIHTAFTRAQQDSRLYNLKLDINDLKQQLRELVLYRELLQARSFSIRPNSDISILRTVGRYFHGFEPGYRGFLEQPEQATFVRSIVDEDFTLGMTGLGVDMLLEQWRRYTSLFHVRETYLHSAEIITTSGDEPSFVVAKCVMDFRGVLTRTAVDMIFPSVLRDPELLLKALGREIAIPMQFHLYFNEDGHLVRHDAVADFFTAVHEAVGGDTCTAARFTTNAHVGQEAMLGPLPQPIRANNSSSLKKTRRATGVDVDAFVESTVERVSRPSIVSPSIDDNDSWDVDQVGNEKKEENVDMVIDSHDYDGRHAVSFLLSSK